MEEEIEPIEIDEELCNEPCIDDQTGEAFICSLPKGHDGPHQTWGEDGELLQQQNTGEEWGEGEELEFTRIGPEEITEDHIQRVEEALATKRNFWKTLSPEKLISGVTTVMVSDG